MFSIGQLVVCVDDSPAGDGWPMPFRQGQVYTISGFGHAVDQFGDLGVYLEEVPALPVRAINGYIYHSSFRSSRFRPVTKRNEEIVASLLQPVLETENA